MTPIKRGEVLFSGIGGGGVLLVGEIVAQAAFSTYRNVVWFPNYSAAVRGGPCECYVIYSEALIASPVLSKVETIGVLDPQRIEDCEGRVRTNGSLIIDSTWSKTTLSRRDIKTFKIPAIEIARSIGNPRGANFILLGFYVQLVGSIPPQEIEKELTLRFGSDDRILSANMNAFKMGLDYKSPH